MVKLLEMMGYWIEYIKNTIDDLMPIYVKLFNIILDTGIVPDTWSLGIMVTIYKK